MHVHPALLDWSWYSTRNFSNTSPVYRGSYSLRMTYNQAWGGLLLHSDTGIPGSSYDTVNLAIKGGSTGGQPFTSLYPVL